MEQSKQAVIVLLQDGLLSDREIREHVRRRFAFAQEDGSIFAVRVTPHTRMQALNACLDRHLDKADRFFVLDAAFLLRADTDTLLQQIDASQADVYCCGDFTLTMPPDGRRTSGAIRCLCAYASFWLFSERAVRRMRTADTVDLVGEMLADKSVRVQIVPGRTVGFKDDRSGLLRRLLCHCSGADVRRLPGVCAALSLAGSLVFLVFLLHGLSVRQEWSTVCLVGCIVCAHLFLLSAAAGLSLWYRGSVRLEKRARRHSYVEESKIQ